MGNGLGALGLTPKTKVAIFLETRAEWMITIQVKYMKFFDSFSNSLVLYNYKL